MPSGADCARAGDAIAGFGSERVAEVRGAGLFIGVDLVDADGHPDEPFTLDVVNALTKRKKEPGQPVARCLWRGTDADGAALWLAELEGGTSGLLRKVGRRWQWFEGPRDEVLANLPGERFEEIVASLS